VRVLVTGATSLLGRATVIALIGAGHDVRTFQRHQGSDGADFVAGDIRDVAATTQAAEGMDTVIHLAARVGVTGGWADYEEINVKGTANVLTSAKEAGVSKFVYVSSPSVAHAGASLVGVGAGMADPDRARGDYSRSKALAERLALQAVSDRFAVVAIRPHLVWGPGDTQLVGRIVDRASQGRLATIGTGAALIDTTYVDNAADALIAAAYRCSDLTGRAFVVTNGEPRTVAEIVARITRAAGQNPPKFSMPAPVARTGGSIAEGLWRVTKRAGDPPMTSFVAEQLSTAHWFDQRETRAALGWSPVVSLDEGFNRLESYFRSAEPSIHESPNATG
jgi:nucleoside-diphosphate-sugar epimerase